ncbi:hypothetical protein PR002_g3320 [Phytophthora rubi]|uniref:Uncharacterized protein n=1 Tax=Phytophthora rubi TaxID=129364 RepID=A0A6A3NDK3_9STRA|nr:hypothetical protein PR002_g3320 [Phytophthora rubi]
MTLVAKLLSTMTASVILTTHQKMCMASSIMPHDSEDDLNAIEEGDNPDDFGGFEFGDGVEEDGIVDEDEDDSEEDEDGEGATAIELDEGDDEDDTEANDPNSAESIAERHFAEKFLNSLGKSDKLMAGSVMGIQDLGNLREHSASEYNGTRHSRCIRVPANALRSRRRGE